MISRTSVSIVALVSAFAGVVLRLQANSLAWPSSYSYTGPRENTGWAIREAALIDVSWFLMTLGLGLLLIAAHSFLRDRVGANRAS